ncbi:MAG: Holliday junction resolvase RuvX [Candidatus Abawacabacteria bacterium]|nr:Holliday junction resolvase RuvX [Candidatus Abawacabacteria bacterium]
MRLLALDYGLRTIGVAITDPGGTFAFARESLANDSSIYTLLPRMLQQESIEKIIIGRSTSIFVQEKAEQFAKTLKTAVHIPIEFIDEMFTTKLALEIPLAIGMKKKDRQNFDDNSAAAAFILENYLNQS